MKFRGWGMTCRCQDIKELSGNDAKAYTAEHLERIGSRASGWEILYRCPDTEKVWLEDYPRGEEHGGGPMRLRQVEDETA
jgi:hypothetical protein